MKKFTLAFILAIIGITAHAQVAPPQKEDFEKIFVKVEKQAMFPGGLAGWKSYLEKNLKAQLAAQYIPLNKKEKSAQRTVYVQFRVDTSGKISEVRAINSGHPDLHPALVDEAIRVIKEGPDWIPAEQNNKKVIYQAIQNITFVVARD